MSCGTSGGYNHHILHIHRRKTSSDKICSHIYSHTHYNYPSVLYHFSHPALYCCYGNKAKIKFDYCQFAAVHLSLLFMSIPPTTPICAPLSLSLSDMSLCLLI